MVSRVLFAVLFCASIYSYGQINALDSLLEHFLHDKSSDRSPLFGRVNVALEKVPFDQADQLIRSKLANVNPVSSDAVELNRFRSFVFSRANLVSEALPIARHALEVARELDDQMTIGRCNLDIGHYYRTLGFYTYSAEYLSEAAKIFSQLNSPRETGQGYYSSALTSYQAGNPVQSLEEQKLSVHYFLQLPPLDRTQDDFFHLMSGYNTMGLSYKRLNLYDSALIFFERADSLAHQLNNALWIKLLGGNKGEVYFLMGDLDRALPLFKADYAEMIKQSETTLIYSAGFNLAEVYLELNQVDSATLLLASLRNYGMPKNIRERYWKIRALIQEKKKDFSSAVQSLRQVILLQDSARIHNEAYNISALKTIYELERKDESIRALSRDVSEQRSRLQQQKLVIIGAVAFLLLLIVLVIMFYRFNRKNKDQLEIIGLQKDEIEEQNAELESQSDALKEVNKRVEEMNVTLEERIHERTQELEAAIAQLNNYLYRSSHDLRRPLTTTIGLAKLYRSGEVDQRTIVDMMEKTAYTLDRMLKKMQMAHELGQESPASEFVDVISLIYKIRKDLLSDAENKKILFTVEMDKESPITVMAPKRLMEIMLFNVIENAVVFAYENELVQPHIIIRTSQTPADIIITISDNGIGFNEDVRERVFEQFFRGSERSRGSGLGLFLVKKTLEKLEGKIEMESEPFQGTRVTLIIPKTLIVIPRNEESSHFR